MAVVLAGSIVARRPLLRPYSVAGLAFLVYSVIFKFEAASNLATLPPVMVNLGFDWALKVPRLPWERVRPFELRFFKVSR